MTKNIVDRDPTTAAWRLEIAGLVERPRTYTFEEIRAPPSSTQETTLMCISNYMGGGLMSNAVWKGLPLRDLLMPAGPRPGIVKVVLHAADGYTDTYSLDKALEPTTFVAYEMNGEPLPVRHGYPMRILTPGLLGEKSVKWVTRIELVDHDVKAFTSSRAGGPILSFRPAPPSLMETSPRHSRLAPAFRFEAMPSAAIGAPPAST